MVNYRGLLGGCTLPPQRLVPPDLSICRNPAQPASSRSKAVDKMRYISYNTFKKDAKTGFLGIWGTMQKGKAGSDHDTEGI